MDYRPGDVVNGYRLNEAGTAWEPLEPLAAPPPAGPQVMQQAADAGLSTGAKVGIAGAVIAVLGVGTVGLAAAVDAGSSSYTCEDIAAETIAISEDDRAVNGYAVLQIYNQEVVYDGRDGDTRVPAGETSAVVFECAGDAAWSDLDETPLVFGVEVDVNGDEWVYYQVP